MHSYEVLNESLLESDRCTDLVTAAADAHQDGVVRSCCLELNPYKHAEAYSALAQ